MAKKILVSFKENPEEQALYEYITSKSDKSAFIKEILKEVIGLNNSITAPIKLVRSEDLFD